ncbi:hypothetical protein ACB094_08G096200 [Castanea mollissima]
MGSKVVLTAGNGLVVVLTGPQGDELWRSITIIGTVAYGVMSNTDNFVLQDSTFNNLWETFKYPSDTLLPSQIMERFGVLYSRQSETNYAQGRFLLRLRDDGDLVLNTINLPTDNPNDLYYKIGTTATAGDFGTSSPGKQLVFNHSGYIYVLTENNQMFLLTKDSGIEDRSLDRIKDHRSVTSLAPSLVARLNHVARSIARRLARSQPSGSGTCGYNNVCTLRSDSRPKCTCPKGFSLLDPNDEYGSCKPEFIQDCDEDEISQQRKDLYSFEVLINTDWPMADYAFLTPYAEDQCKQSCMEDCMCAVAIFRGASCWKKKLPLSNGRVDSRLNGGKTFIKIRNNNSIPHPDPRRGSPESTSREEESEQFDPNVVSSSRWLCVC